MKGRVGEGERSCGGGGKVCFLILVDKIFLVSFIVVSYSVMAVDLSAILSVKYSLTNFSYPTSQRNQQRWVLLKKSHSTQEHFSQCNNLWYRVQVDCFRTESISHCVIGYCFFV